MDRAGFETGRSSGRRGSYLTLWLFRFPLEICAMELNGALSNRDLGDRLLSIAGLLQRLGRLTGVKPPTHRPMARHSGAVRDAVFEALRASQQPLRAREVHAAAEALAGEALSWNTVKDCLHKSARDSDVPIERVRHGLYCHQQVVG